MGTRVFDQSIFIGTDDSLVSTSSDYHYLSISGDTLLIATNRTPSSSSDTGNQGEICWDSSYIYVCTSANTWRRVSIATW